MNVNLELYRIFCEVAKYKNLSKAAENMYVSQSAVTQSIKKLEDQLGGKLFFRNKSGVELTPEGNNLYEYVKDSIEKMSNAENIFSQYINLERGKIRIGGGRVLTEKYILPSLMDIIKEYPNIEISMSRLPGGESLKKVANGELDLAILNMNEKTNKYANVEMSFLKKLDSRYIVFANKEYIDKNNIKSKEDLNDKNIILPKTRNVVERFEKYCMDKNITMYNKIEVQDAELIKKMICNGCGIGFSAKEYIDDEWLKDNDIVILDKKDFPGDELCIATLKKSMCNKVVLELLKRLKTKN